MRKRIERLTEHWMNLIENTQKRWQWLGKLLAYLSWIYILILIFNSWEQLKEIHWKSFWAPVVLGIFLYLLSLIIQFLIWAQLITHHRQINWYDVVIYSRSIFLRRLPGGIWHWIGRTTMYMESSNIPPKTIMLANFLELILFVGMAAVIALAGWDQLPLAMRIGFGLLALAFLGWIFSAWLAPDKSLAKKVLETSRILVLSALSWFAGAVLLWIYVINVGSNSFTLLDAVWTWALSGGISMMIIVIPSGLGLREITLSALLIRFITLPEAILVAVLIRFIFLFSDIIWGGLGLVISNRFYTHSVIDKTAE